MVHIVIKIFLALKQDGHLVLLILFTSCCDKHLLFLSHIHEYWLLVLDLLHGFIEYFPGFGV